MHPKKMSSITMHLVTQNNGTTSRYYVATGPGIEFSWKKSIYFTAYRPKSPISDELAGGIPVNSPLLPGRRTINGTTSR